MLGTGFSGESFMKATYLELGIKEVDDQIAAAEVGRLLSCTHASVWAFATASTFAGP